MDKRLLTVVFAAVVLIVAGATIADAQSTRSAGQMSGGQPSQGATMQPGAAAMPNQPVPASGVQPSMPQGGGMTGMQPPMPGGMPGGGMQPPVQGTGPTGGPQGPCVIKISEDRTSIALIDQTGQQVNHVALGQDRIQKIFNAPDGSWSVVVYKVRRVNQFGGIAINLAQCEPQEAREFQAVPGGVEFQGEEMAVRYPGGSEERYPLGNKEAALVPSLSRKFGEVLCTQPSAYGSVKPIV